MSFLFIFLNILYFAFSSQENSCSYLSTLSNDFISLEACKSLQTDDDNELQCCVTVQSIMGQNTYFCESYNKSNTEEDISHKMQKLINNQKKSNLGVEVKAKASCTEDVTPFKSTKCNIEDTQNSTEFWNCSEFIKEQNDNYCCLFNGTVGTSYKTDVQFCYEIDKEQVYNMKGMTEKIARKSQMENINYLTCFPDIPEKPNSNGFYFGLNNIFSYLVLILSLIL